MTFLLFITAIALSGVAAYYSIAGLMAIFAAAIIPILIMGSTLEVAKLVVASWLYRSWKTIPMLMKTYFVTALIVLMSLTSMGIFGYLSKAHLDQEVPAGDAVAQLELIDQKIITQKEIINANRKELSQLDTQVDQAVSRNTSANGNERSIQIRRTQLKDRERIANDISKAQAQAALLSEQRSPIASSVRKIEAEVGPIKYIAALIYGDSTDKTLLESAVRIMIMLIVFVFDPLAVLMLIAANWQMRQNESPPVPRRDKFILNPLPEAPKAVFIPQVMEEAKIPPKVELTVEPMVEVTPIGETPMIRTPQAVSNKVTPNSDWKTL
ncbi:hypothetical protein UFOVP58_43 [uncultured Caudovirales phage]|uniref:Uncharacterized protein n=1 Tax=uncultured Caudovirales phage TaxID=2100421 RepID=A0A6J5KUG5_9CAUD|nr:hypothetical protein UFOVP58_43 [uncultured Caudovirales phage]